jgi:hypothetical protein
MWLWRPNASLEEKENADRETVPAKADSQTYRGVDQIMSDRIAPPLGVYPRFLWDEEHPEPSLDDVKERYCAVFEAKMRYLAVGVPGPDKWEVEIAHRIDQMARLLGLPTLWETFNSLIEPVPQSLFPSPEDDPQPIIVGVKK